MRWAAVLGGRRRPVSRVLCPQYADGDHLSSPRRPAKAGGGSGRLERRCRRGRLERRCRRGQAANPGTSRALVVPLFGLAPGGVWPRRRRRRRRALLPPDFTLTRRRRRPGAGGRYVSVPLSVPAGGVAADESWALPSTLPGGARTFLPAPASRRAAATCPAQPSTANLAQPRRLTQQSLYPNRQPPPPPTQAQPQSAANLTSNHCPTPRKSPPFAKGGLGGLSPPKPRPA